MLRSISRAWQRWPGAYTSPKELLVYDSRLRYAQLGALGLIVGFILIQMLLLHSDSKFESPIGSINVWSRFADLPPLPANTPQPVFCNNPLYDFVPTAQDLQTAGGLTVRNSSCPQVNVASLTTLTTSSLSAASWVSRVLINYTCADGTVGDCPPVESDRVNFFNSRVAEVPINVIHAFSTTFGLKESNVATRMLRADGTVFAQIAEGSPLVGFTVQDYLDLAGVSLDSRNIQGYLSTAADPFYRLTGIVLLAKIKYTNKRAWEYATEARADMTVEAVKSAWGYSGGSIHWIDYPRLCLREDISAVQVRFVVEGSLGTLDHFTIVLSIMAGAFLINVARIAVDLVATYCIARSDREAFVAAKYGRPLELNRQHTGERHTHTTRQKSRSAHKYLKKKSLVGCSEAQLNALAEGRTDDEQEEDEHADMFRLRSTAKRAPTVAFAAPASSASPPLIHPFAVPEGASDTAQEAGLLPHRSLSSRTVHPANNAALPDASRTPSDSNHATAAAGTDEQQQQQQPLLATSPQHSSSPPLEIGSSSSPSSPAVIAAPPSADIAVCVSTPSPV